MFNEAVITTAGLALDAKIRAGEAVAKFTNIKLGDGQYSGTEDLNEATALKSVRQTFGVSSIKRTNETTVRLRIIADNGGMADGYYISELGVYAEDPDDGEILYSIATGMTGKMDYQPSEEELEGATSTIDIFTSVSNAESAIISTGTGAAASAEELADLEIRTSNLETPEFDDSGEVEGIGSFPDFLERVKSKMDFFRFFRDFKAGMKFVLHAGQIVNNCMSDSTELPLGASQGKVLMDLITQLNSNLSSKIHIGTFEAGTEKIININPNIVYLLVFGHPYFAENNGLYIVCTQNVENAGRISAVKALDKVIVSINSTQLKIASTASVFAELIGY